MGRARSGRDALKVDAGAPHSATPCTWSGKGEHMETAHFRKTSDIIYCPYTDREFPRDRASAEHVIPLSLGGANALTIPIDKSANSTLGSELDGALANEFLVALRRTEYDARGHSGKEPWATIRNATYGESDRPAQAHFHRKHGIRLWDAQDRQMRPGGGDIRIQTNLNIDLPVRFTAKVALAAGYFVYGDLFRDHVDHRQLRDVMRIDPTRLNLTGGGNNHPLRHITIRIDHYLLAQPPESDWQLNGLRAFCSDVRGSVVILIPGDGVLGVTVGLLGQFLATVIAPADTNSFPNEGAYAWGHVLAVTDGKLGRCSWVDALTRWVSPSQEETI